MPILGSSTQVLWHSGHLEGLLSFSSENSKPQARQRAGSMAALYAVCFRLRRRCRRSSRDLTWRLAHAARNLGDAHRVPQQHIN